MANRTRQARRSLPKILIVLGVLVAGCALTYGIVRAAGWLDKTAPLSQKPSREGMVRVPKSLVNLQAFEVVQREDVYNLANGDDSYFWLPKRQVDAHPEWITRVDDIIGRVMARDKRSDFVFSDKDFLPEGSRSGIAGGVPSGKQGFFLDADKVPGLRFLKKGDRFDLLASLPDQSAESSSEYGQLMGGIKARGGKPVPLDGVRILVQNAELIALTTSRSMTTQGGLQLTEVDSRGRASTSSRDERVAIAIEPVEAVPLTQALGDELNIHMVTRSGQETDPMNEADVLKGRIAIPAAAVSIDVFQPIRASDLAEPGTSELRHYYFEPADIRDDWITRPEDLIGRFVRKSIESGYIFTESDFLPAGSLINEVNAYETLETGDLVDGWNSKMAGRVVARDLAAGTELSERDLLPPDSLVRKVEAYQSLEPDDLVDGRMSKLIGQVVARSFAAGTTLTEDNLLPPDSLIREVNAFDALKPADLVGGTMSELTGRVAARDLVAGARLSENDLLPPGAKPGFAATIPPDRMAISVDAKAIQGAARLSRGDTCDLLASSPFDVTKALSGIEVSPSLRANVQSKAVNRVLATEAIVIDNSGEQSEEIVLAVYADEVSAISKAIALKEPVFCIARTSATNTGKDETNALTTSDTTDESREHAGDERSNGKEESIEKEESRGRKVQLASDPNPLNDISITETLIGGRRSARAYRRSQ